MSRTAVGLVATREGAERLIGDLIQNGFRRDDISLVTRDEQGRNPAEHEALGSVEKGAKKGAAIGGIGGFLVGFAAIPLVFTGIGSVLVAGPIVAALAGTAVGAFAGGLIGVLTHAGVTEADAKHFTEGVREGGVLITVATDASGADKAMQIMTRHGAITEWNEDGTPRRRTPLRPDTEGDRLHR
jgi:uncharacterized membrane protein